MGAYIWMQGTVGGRGSSLPHFSVTWKGTAPGGRGTDVWRTKESLCHHKEDIRWKGLQMFKAQHCHLKGHRATDGGGPYGVNC